MTAPIRSMDVPQADELLGTVRTLQDAVEIFRLMKERLGLTNEFLDDAGGLTKGHTDKVLGRSEQKRLGYDTFALFAEMFAVEFRVYVNMDAVKRMEQVWDARAPRWFPDAKPGRISKKIVKAASPIVYQETGRLGGMVRCHVLTPKHRSEIARKAAKSRWKKAKRQPVRCSARGRRPASTDAKSEAIT